MLKNSIWQIQHEAGHPNNLQGSCPICIFEKKDILIPKNIEEAVRKAEKEYLAEKKDVNL